MKIIEAMKRVKANKEKVADLQNKLAQHCANLNFETLPYGDNTKQQIKDWLQSCRDVSQDNVQLLCAIQRTNLVTEVAIELNGKVVTKSISEWVWRRREYAVMDLMTWSKLTDRNLKEGNVQTSPGTVTEVKIVRHFDPPQRDEMLAMFRNEPHAIDAALEVVNAVTDLVTP